jgi:TIGR00730 family protein
MNITVYCGASLGNQPEYQQAAVTLGQWIAQKKYTLIYGGGRAGLMGLLADTVLANGGKVIGIIPAFLQARELTHSGCTKLIVVNSMAERKANMLKLADACIALPGGPGTLEEITEVYSWTRLGKNPHPCILFNTNGFYEPLRAMYQRMVETDFLTETYFKKLLFSDNFTEIERFIAEYQPPEIRTY